MSEEEVTKNARFEVAQDVRVNHDPLPWMVVRRYWSEEERSIVYDVDRNGICRFGCPERILFEAYPS